MNHSQRLNDPQLKPWVMIRKDGVVLGAHCNCTAGLGECCSHMAAVLFKMWATNEERRDEKLSVTSKKCKWSRPSEEAMRKVEFAEGRHIIFNASQRPKKEAKPQDHSVKIPPLTSEETSELYKKLSQCQTAKQAPIKPAILSIIEGHADAYIPSMVKLDLPKPLSDLYDGNNRKLSLEDLQDKAKDVLEDMAVTKEQVITKLHYTHYVTYIHLRIRIENKPLPG